MTANEGWEEYWRRAPAEPAYRGRVGPQAEPGGFWHGVFSHLPRAGDSLRVLDFACGSGAVSELATHGLPTRERLQLFAFDLSPMAIAAYRGRFPSAPAVVADARSTPFASASFDLVASQFGIEYAGLDAIGEAARLVKPGGSFAAILHSMHGPLYRECRTNLEVCRTVQQSGLLGFFEQAMLDAAHREAEVRLRAALATVEEVLRGQGPRVAGGSIHRLVADIVHMRGRRSAYDPREIVAWIRRMSVEIDAFAKRMSLMQAVALDAQGIEAAAERALACDLRVRARGGLSLGSEDAEPAAWLLVCERTPTQG